jgi:hypothetical protein
MPIVGFSYVIYTLSAFSLGILSCLAPPTLIEKPELQGIFTFGKILAILAFLIHYT